MQVIAWTIIQTPLTIDLMLDCLFLNFDYAISNLISKQFVPIVSS